MAFKWSPMLETGIEMLDTQHQELIHAANEFFESHKKGESKVAMQNCLDFLAVYIQRHFREEEALQLKSNYSRYAAHCGMHEDLAAELVKQVRVVRFSEYDAKSVDGLQDFLVNWVEQHIFEEDLDFAGEYRAQMQRRE